MEWRSGLIFLFTLITIGGIGFADLPDEELNPGKAWRYSFESGDNDSSVSGWASQVPYVVDPEPVSIERALSDLYARLFPTP